MDGGLSKRTTTHPMSIDPAAFAPTLSMRTISQNVRIAPSASSIRRTCSSSAKRLGRSDKRPPAIGRESIDFDAEFSLPALKNCRRALVVNVIE